MKQDREPFILLLLKFPFIASTFLIRVLGFAAFAPVYFFLSTFKSFLFSEKFETDNTYYVLYWLPRQITVIAAYFLGTFEGLYIGKLVYQATIPEGMLLSYCALFSSLVGMIFLYRQGYKEAYNKYKLGQLKSVKEHLEILYQGLQDIIAIIFAIGVLALLVNIKRLFRF